MKPNIPPRKPAASSGPFLSVKWKNSLVYAGPYPIQTKRFFKMETFSNAVEKCFVERDRFLWAGLKSATGEAPVTSILCDLIYEDAMRLVFSLTAATQSRKNVFLRLVAAKNHEECSAAINRECSVLSALQERCPGRVPGIIERGFIFLPDRHLRREVNREVSAYLYRAPLNLAPLYVASSSQFGPRNPKPLRYSLKESDLIRRSIIRTLAGCYDDKTFTGVDPGDLGPECFAIEHPVAANPSVSLIQCPRLRKRMPPGQLVQKLLFGILGTGNVRLAIAPAKPADFFNELAGAVTEEKARKWCGSFLDHQKTRPENARGDRDVELPGRNYFEVLSEEING